MIHNIYRAPTNLKTQDKSPTLTKALTELKNACQTLEQCRETLRENNPKLVDINNALNAFQSAVEVYINASKIVVYLRAEHFV